MKRFMLMSVICFIAVILSGPSWLYAYEGETVSNGGTIVGEVKLNGPIPPPKKIKVDKDVNVCGKEKVLPTLIVSHAKGIENAVVSIKDIKKGKKLEIPAKKPELVQKHCMFSPHVSLIPLGPKGTTVAIINDDPITHNIHTFSFDNAPINQAQPKTVREITASFEVPETIKVQCDIHTKWMSAWFIAVDQPYYAVTNAAGGFKLTDVPPGTYQLQAWQETLGTETKEVVVKPGKETKVTFEFKPKK
jgi:plastocyanin